MKSCILMVFLYIYVLRDNLIVNLQICLIISNVVSKLEKVQYILNIFIS